MQMIKCFGKSMVSIAVLAVFGGVNAAEPTRGHVRVTQGPDRPFCAISLPNHYLLFLLVE